MPLTVSEIFKKVGLEPSEAIKWNTKILSNENGVYVISLSDNPSVNKGVLNKFEINEEVFDSWKTLSPELNVNGQISKKIIESELNQYWRASENILYIGESSSKTNGISKRVNQFYIHQVGWKGPHTGGYWIKLLSQLEDLYVYYAACDNPRDTEFKMLLYFIEQTSGKSFYDIEQLGDYLPFANLKIDSLKKHYISNVVQRKSKRVNK